MGTGRSMRLSALHKLGGPGRKTPRGCGAAGLRHGTGMRRRGGVEGRGGEMGGVVLQGGAGGPPKRCLSREPTVCPPPFLQCLCSHSFKISKIIVVGDLAVGKTCLINR